MKTYIIRRLLLTIPTIFLVTIIVFFSIRLIPGSIVDAMVSQQMIGGGGTLVLNRADIEHKLGLDQPIIIQYGHWIVRLVLHGDLGKSLWRNVPVTEEIGSRLPITIELGILGIIIAQLIALPIGIYSALRQDSLGDYAARTFAIICIAIPGFWIATLIIVFASIWWRYSPPMMVISFFKDPIGNLGTFIIPSIILGMGMAGGTMRYVRTMMLEVLRQDYIRTAWAKGLSERVVVMRHALKNALIPIITIIGYQVPVIIGGTVIIENIFNLPGMGRLLMNALSMRDYAIVAGVMIVIGLSMVLINLATDLTYDYLDPRTRHTK